MPKGEFQNRDRDESSNLGGIPLAGSLGDLPEDLSEDRGERAYQIRNAGVIQPDMRSAAKSATAARDTGIGSPILDYTVRSVYDSRPTSGYDFNEWFIAEAPPGNNDFRNAYTVPQGYVAVLRGVRVLTGPIAYTFPYLMAINFVLNNSIISPAQIREPAAGCQLLHGIGIDSGDTVDTFLIADEGQTIGITIDDTFHPVPNVEITVGFYGNLLLKTGVPALFQIANLAGKSQTAVTSTLKQITGNSGVEISRRRRRKPFADVPIFRDPK